MSPTEARFPSSGASGTAPAPDFLDPSFWLRPHEERAEVFERLRAQPGPEFVPPRLPWGPMANGYWALAKHADILEVSRRPQDFSSEGATGMVGPELGEFYGSMITMDNPEHARLRRIVSRSFGRNMAPAFASMSHEVARRLVAALVERGPGDFVRPVAADMPIAVLSTMMGIPPDDYEFLFERTSTIMGALDPEFVSSPEEAAAAVLGASRDLGDYIAGLREDRLAHPRPDVVTRLVQVQEDGEQLTGQELVSFFILLVNAGMETTRNAISRALVLLTEHPEQRALLLSDFERHAPNAVEEILRVATPINWMRRTATRDCDMNGHRFHEGDQIFLLYWSANHDEKVFADPYRFDITRDPNPQLSFGAPGPHFCLGAHLARIEIAALYRELLTALPEIRATGEPSRLASSFIEGYKRLDCAF
ncbi:cytochrome P450 [Streptomyces sp. NPDC021224]|uniref:cytochrome P450 n=1 Tax=unclassified Streptomyces TaxID=2593676 RepID=UPI0037999549